MTNGNPYFGKTRKFGSETFKLVATRPNHKQARALADAYRRRGYKARIVESLTKRYGLVYAIYVK